MCQRNMSSLWLLLILSCCQSCCWATPEYDYMQVQIFANYELPRGKPTPILITNSKLPRGDFYTRVTSSNENFLYQYWTIEKDKYRNWKHSDNLRQELTNAGIERDYTLEYNSGYYASFQATFWDFGEFQLQVEHMRVEVEPPPEFKGAVTSVKITKPSTCVPTLHIQGCSNPVNPMNTPMAKAHLFTAEVETCNAPEKPTYSWSAWDKMETKNLANFDSTTLPQLHTKRYGLKLNPPYLHVYDKDMITIKVQAIINGVTVIARCYLNMVRGALQAVIGGGLTRTVSTTKAFLLDGSLSRDLSDDPGVNAAHLLYYWRCTTDCAKTRYCSSNMGTANKIRVPSYALKTGCVYTYKLTVTSDDDDGRTSTMNQVVAVVNYDTIQVYIKCIANCGNDLYNPNDKVELLGMCLDCPPGRTDWDWVIDGVPMVETQRMFIFINTAHDVASVKLIVTARDGRTNSARKWLRRNLGPKHGKCYIVPKRGIEFKTEFRLRCLNFKSKYTPLHYFLVAAKVIQAHFYTGEFWTVLPATHSVMIRVCDVYNACLDVTLDVNVEPQQIPVDGKDALENFLSTDPNNVIKLFEKGERIKAYTILNAAATRLGTYATDAAVILRLFSTFDHYTNLELGKLANLTRSMFRALTPFDDADAKVLTHAVEEMNEIFERISQNHEVELLKQYPYRNITLSCMAVYQMFKNMTDQMIQPPKYIYKMIKEHKRLKAEHVEKARKEIAKIPDPGMRFVSYLWLNATYNENMLYHYLHFAFEMEIGMDDVGTVISNGVAMEVHCLYNNETKPRIIKTRDGINTVTFSVELLRELAEKLQGATYFCLHVLSVSRSLNWWYPEERQPSERLLTVRAYSNTAKFTGETSLRNRLSFRILAGKYKPAHETPSDASSRQYAVKYSVDNLLGRELDMERLPKNWNYSERSSQRRRRGFEEYVESDSGWLVIPPEPRVVDDTSPDRISTDGLFENMLQHDQLEFYTDAKMYRVNIDSHSLLAVRFLNTSHDLRVVLQTENQPIRNDIEYSSCLVKSSQQDKTMLLRNMCKNTVKGYMGVGVYRENSDDSSSEELDNGTVEYSFIFQLRDCDDWEYNLTDPQWSQKGCAPSMELDIAMGIRCDCDVLTTYTAYVYNAHAISVPMGRKLQLSMLEHGAIIQFYVVVMLLLLLLLILVWYCSGFHRTVMCSMADEQEFAGVPEHEFLIHVRTGGRISSGTTANITLKLMMQNRQSVCFTILQDPMHPQLERNSTHTMLLRSRIIRLPARAYISHDGNGRFPSWFLCDLVIQDVTLQQTQFCKLREWMRAHKMYVLDGVMLKQEASGDFGHSWCSRFRHSMERNFTNWFCIQPLNGSWRWELGRRKFSRFERVCIWVNKIFVTLCICAVYFQRTTVNNYEEFRESVRQKPLPITDVIILGIICFIASCLVQFFFEFILVRWVD